MCGLELFGGDVSTTDQGFRVEGSNAALCLDQVVHQGLRHRGVITFVVTASAVADEVDDNISLEFLAIRKGNLCHPEYRLGVITVDVENWRLNGLRHI